MRKALKEMPQHGSVKCVHERKSSRLDASLLKALKSSNVPKAKKLKKTRKFECDQVLRLQSKASEASKETRFPTTLARCCIRKRYIVSYMP